MFNSSSAYNPMFWPVLIMGFFLSGCGSTSELFTEDHLDEAVNVDYSVIYYIHADSDYLYHDVTGNPIRGNSKILDTALGVSKEAKSGEIFVFYHRPENKIMGLFPQKKSRLFHYVNGELTGLVKYRHTDKSEDFLTTEARLFNQYRTQSGEKNQRNYFLYFGHEIPDDDGDEKIYHRTLPDIEVNTGSFSKGIQKFLVTDEHRFNLLVLSTCNNGTPSMAAQLMPFTDIMLASPQNLHLSHIDSKSLGLIETNPGISSIQLADSMAERTFNRLEAEISTTITLTVYDFEIVQEQKNELQAFAEHYDTLGNMQFSSDNIDCREAALFEEEIFKKGLKTWYKPARFGRQSNSNTHSGWGCKPITEDGREL